jgi:carbonic anhydrase
LAAGFLLGSKLGRAPYEKVEAQVRQLKDRPEVQKARSAATEIVHEQVADLVDKATDKVDATAPARERTSA